MPQGSGEQAVMFGGLACDSVMSNLPHQWVVATRRGQMESIMMRSRRWKTAATIDGRNGGQKNIKNSHFYPGTGLAAPLIKNGCAHRAELFGGFLVFSTVEMRIRTSLLSSEDTPLTGSDLSGSRRLATARPQ